MGNSKTTSPSKTSKSTTTQNNALATKQTTFAIGDVVLCPSLSMQSFTLEADPYGKRDDLTITYDGSYHYYDAQGFFIRSNDTETSRYQTSLFHDTPANRQAIATLYGNTRPVPSRQRKTIDITEAGEKEAVLMSSRELSNIACDIHGAATILEDLGDVLSMIYLKKVSLSTAQSLARLAHDSSTTWSELLFAQLDALNEPLSQSHFGKVGA